MSNFTLGDKVQVSATLEITGIQTAKSGCVLYQTDHGFSVRERVLEEMQRAAKSSDAEPKPEPAEPIKLYCVQSDIGSFQFEKGKVYEHKNMRIYAENGGSTSYSSKWINDHFVPLVKRPAKVGEWVYITESDYPKFIGTIAVVKKINSDGSYLTVNHKKIVWFANMPDSSENTGFSTSETRYLVLDGYQPEPEEPKYYSGKVVCTRNIYENDSEFFTPGKVYEFKKGVVRSNTGNEYNAGEPIESLEKMTGWCSEFVKFLGE